MSASTTKDDYDKKTNDIDGGDTASGPTAQDVQPVTIISKAAAQLLVHSFSSGRLAPSFETFVKNRNPKKENNAPFDTTTVVINDNANDSDDDDENIPLVTQEAIKELSKLGPQEQYDIVKQQVEASFGSLFEYEAQEQLLAQQARLKNQLFIGSKLFGTATGFRLEDEKENLKELKQGQQIKTASSDTDIVAYVKQELNNLIDKQKENKTVSGRAVGADRAFTGIGNTLKNVDYKTQLNLTDQGYRNVSCDIDKTLLSDDAIKLVESKNLILIEAGSYVGDVCDHYWPKDKYNSLKDENGDPYKVLPNRGGYKILSIVGLSAVGAMGFSGYDGKQCNVGAIQSAIQSIEMLCVQDGKVVHYQIEPKNGIHSGKEKELLEKGIILMNKDDQVFSDVVTSMGCYGVIVRVFISMEDAYYLAEHREKVKLKNWEKRFDEIISNKNTGGDVYVFEIWGNPYKWISDLITPQSMVFTWWVKVDGPPADPKDIEQYGGAERGSISLGTMKTSGYALQVLANSGLKGGVAAGLDTGLNQTLFSGKFSGDNKSITMSYVQAVDFGTPNGMPTQTSGNSFPVNDIKTVVNGYVDFLNQQSDKNSLMITSPFAVRFSKKSFGSVSCAGEYDVAWIEQPILTVGKESWSTRWGYRTAKENANRLLIASREWFQSNTKSKIHWGLYFDEGDAMPSEYPWWQYISDDNKKSFFKNYKFFNKDGIFKNGFTMRSGLDNQTE